jgi:hypothetical protein
MHKHGKYVYIDLALVKVKSNAIPVTDCWGQ